MTKLINSISRVLGILLLLEVIQLLKVFWRDFLMIFLIVISRTFWIKDIPGINIALGPRKESMRLGLLGP